MNKDDAVLAGAYISQLDEKINSFRERFPERTALGDLVMVGVLKEFDLYPQDMEFELFDSHIAVYADLVEKGEYLILFGDYYNAPLSYGDLVDIVKEMCERHELGRRLT